MRKSLSGNRRPEHERWTVGYPLLLLPGCMGYGGDEHRRQESLQPATESGCQKRLEGL